MQLTHLRRFVRSAEYIESTYNYETTDVQMRSGKAVRAPSTALTTPHPATTLATAALAAGILCATALATAALAIPARSAARSAAIHRTPPMPVPPRTRHGACHRPRRCRPRRHLPRRRRRRLTLTPTLTQVAVPKKIEYQFRTQVIR